MTSLLMLIPVALLLGLVGLGAFLWAMKSGQFDDLDGAAHRILFDDDDDLMPDGDRDDAAASSRLSSPGRDHDDAAGGRQ